MNKGISKICKIGSTMIATRVASKISDSLITNLIILAKQKLVKTIEFDKYGDCGTRQLSEWLASRYKLSKLGATTYASDDIQYLTPGSYIVWFMSTPILVTLGFDDIPPSKHCRYNITFSVISHKCNVLYKFIDEYKKYRTNRIKSKTHTVVSVSNNKRYRVQRRTFDNVFMTDHNLTKLKSAIDTFIADKDNYMNNGLTYKLNILLYGPPGTGKTSIVKAIASYAELDIYSDNMIGLAKCSRHISEMLVCEDVDVSNLTTDRDKSEGCDRDTDLSIILNNMDGLTTTCGISVFTTNNKEALDAAVVRPGRIDLALLIGYVTEEVFIKFLNKHYPEHTYTEDDICVKEGLVMAEVQESILRHDSLEKVMELYCTTNKKRG